MMETKLQPPSMRFIRSHIRSKQYRVSVHATKMRLERGITITEIERALISGEIIESYLEDAPYPSRLVLGWLASGDPLHIVCSRGDIEPALRIVTVYEPDDALWKSDYKTRR